MPDRSHHSPHLARRHAPRRGSVVPVPSVTVRPLAKLDAPLAIGARLRHERELRGLSLEEVARATRIALISLERVEADRFDDLPGEVFVRGFLRSYAKAIGVDPDEILALYGSARRVPQVAPVPVNTTGSGKRESRRVGVAIAFVLLLVLCTMALSFVLRPRGRDLPSEVSSVVQVDRSHA
jgi:transcriptional regulator with XRE-family HTH domain